MVGGGQFGFVDGEHRPVDVCVGPIGGPQEDRVAVVPLVARTCGSVMVT